MKIRIVEGLFICTIYTLVLKMAAILFDRLAFWGDVLLVAGWIFILAFVLLKSRGKILAFKTTGRILSAFHINNPDNFPSLNLSALKRHINLIIKDPKCHFNSLIRSIVLYHGFDDLQYVLVVEKPDTISTDDKNDYQELINHWSDPTCLRYFVRDNFRAEVYRNKANGQADQYLEDWFVWTKEPKDDIPKELVLKDYRWVLYRK